LRVSLTLNGDVLGQLVYGIDQMYDAPAAGAVHYDSVGADEGELVDVGADHDEDLVLSDAAGDQGRDVLVLVGDEVDVHVTVGVDAVSRVLEVVAGDVALDVEGDEGAGIGGLAEVVYGVAVEAAVLDDEAE